MSTDTDRIRMLNDELRKSLFGGGAVITAGIAELGAEAVERLVKTIAVFDDFCHANDPHEEHDFGVFEFDGVAVMFKIDYLDINPSTSIRRIPQIPRSPSESSPS